MPHASRPDSPPARAASRRSVWALYPTPRAAKKRRCFSLAVRTDNQRVADLASIDSKCLVLKKIAGAQAVWSEQSRANRHRQRRAVRLPPGSAPFIGQIDKASAGILRRWSLSSMGNSPSAWAFAHWGGRFYIFITANVSAADALDGVRVRSRDRQGHRGQDQRQLQSLAPACQPVRP
jgi:hypothetical protein